MRFKAIGCVTQVSASLLHVLQTRCCCCCRRLLAERQALKEDSPMTQRLMTRALATHVD